MYFMQGMHKEKHIQTKDSETIEKEKNLEINWRINDALSENNDTSHLSLFTRDNDTQRTKK